MSKSKKINKISIFILLTTIVIAIIVMIFNNIDTLKEKDTENISKTAVLTKPADNGAYYNNMAQQKVLADPTMIKNVSDNCYYIYGSSSTKNAGLKIKSYKTCDLKNYEEFYISFNNLPSYDYFWAPEIYKINSTYYMLFTLVTWGDGYPSEANSRGSVYYAKSTDLKNFTYVGEVPYGYNTLKDKVYTTTKSGNTILNTNHIDGSLLIDGSNIYHYYKMDGSYKKGTGSYQGEEIYAIKLRLNSSGNFEEAGTPQVVMRRNTECGNVLDTDANGGCSWSWYNWNQGNDFENIDEGPSVVKYGSKYYLMYSVGEYTNNSYHVRLATSSSPTGPFIRSKSSSTNSLNGQYNINKLLYGHDYPNTNVSGTNSNLYLYGTGHNSTYTAEYTTTTGKRIVDYYTDYHSNIYENGVWKDRKFTLDEMGFTSSGDLFVNGPTTDIQPFISGTTYNGKTYFKVPKEQYTLSGFSNISSLSDRIKYTAKNVTVNTSSGTTLSIEMNTEMNLTDIWLFGTNTSFGSLSGTLYINEGYSNNYSMSFNESISSSTFRLQLPAIKEQIKNARIAFNKTVNLTEVQLISDGLAEMYQVEFDHNGGIVNTSNNFKADGTHFSASKGYINYNGNKPVLTLTYSLQDFNDLGNDIPTKTGYKFKGWYTELSGGTQVYKENGQYNSSASSYWTSDGKWNHSSHIKLYAQWEELPKENYTITFNANGGSVGTTSKIVTSGSTYGTLPTPTRSGYTFDGWYTSATGGSQVTSSTSVTITSNQTLYAHWTEKIVTYTVTFNANGGNVETTSKTVTSGSNYGTLPTPTRSGYTFDGWYTSATGGSQVTSSTSVTITSNQTLYAHWTEIPVVNPEYTITFNANGGSVSPSTKKVTKGSTYGTLPTPSRSGYIFSGWYTSATGGSQVTSSTSVTITSNQTLYARWGQTGEPPLPPAEYTITFNANGGSVGTSSKIVTSGSTYGTLPTPTKSGHTFAGWYTSATGGSQVTSSTEVKITSNQTLYAHWTANSYTVTFNANGGSVGTTSKIVTFGSTYGTLPTPTRSGHTFAGWYTSATGGSQVTSSTDVTITSNQTLYAHWTANSYIVTFNANGGSVGSTSKTVTYELAYGTLPTPTRSGHTFAGWYTEVTGGIRITTSTTVTITSNHTLYAHWTKESEPPMPPAEYTITFNVNGGSVGTPSKTVTSGSTYGTLPTPTRSGYIFNGWYTSATGGSQVTSNTEVKITSNQTLYAHWTKESDPPMPPAEYTITFNANGGSVETTNIKVTSGSTYGTLPTPTKSGYIFDGWYTQENGGTKIISSTEVTITSNHTLYAHWTKESDPPMPPAEYTITFNANGGSVETTNIKVTSGSTYGDLPIPTRSGYIFEGWYISTSDGTKITSSTEVKITSDQTLYAMWKEEEVTNPETGKFNKLKNTFILLIILIFLAKLLNVRRKLNRI